MSLILASRYYDLGLDDKAVELYRQRVALAKKITGRAVRQSFQH